jgi:predicted ATPase with chaperone activity
VQRYRNRIAGPLLDRIDIHVDVPAVKFRELTGSDVPETDSSTVIRRRVIAARERQLYRFGMRRSFQTRRRRHHAHAESLTGRTVARRNSNDALQRRWSIRESDDDEQWRLSEVAVRP